MRTIVATHAVSMFALLVLSWKSHCASCFSTQASVVTIPTPAFVQRASSLSYRLTTTTLLRMAKRRPGKQALRDELSSSEQQAPFPSSNSRRTTTRKASSASTNRSKKSKTSETSATKSSATSGVISPDLAKWLEEQSGQPSTDNEQEPTRVSQSTVSDSANFEVLLVDETKSSVTSTRSDRRNRQAEREAAKVFHESQIQDAVEKLESLLDGKQPVDVNQLLKELRNLVRLEGSKSVSASLRQLTASSTNSYQYRLAWVGSDDALCQVGTGLHKVPLARLQEVFWICGPRNQIQILEVIRILGPFPNVKNTLQGTSKVLSSSSSSNEESATTWEITWDSMIDGTGKEILAGSTENSRRVDMQVLFCDQSIMVAVVGGNDSTDPLQDGSQGSNLMVFLREDALSDKLDALRVS